MGGAWTNGFQSVGKRRPMGGRWNNGIRMLGKRNMDDFWGEDDDDEMMDFMKKKSALPQIFTQRLGKRSDLGFLNQRMGKRLYNHMGKRMMQRFGRIPTKNTNFFRMI